MHIILYIITLAQPPKIPSILKISTMPPIPMWESHQFIADCLMLQSDLGDIQTALSVLIAIGDARKLLLIDDALIVIIFYTIFTIIT